MALMYKAAFSMELELKALLVGMQGQNVQH